MSFISSVFGPMGSAAFAGVPDVSIMYSTNPAKAGEIIITANYSEPLNGSGVYISIDQPGSIDITNEPMTDMGSGIYYSYTYTVHPHDRTSHIDGNGVVSLSGAKSLSTGEAANIPNNSTFTIDTTAPAVSLSGSAIINLSIGETFVDPGANWSDAIDGDGFMATSNTGDILNTNTTGTYVLGYTHTDAAGNIGTGEKRTINVGNTKPTITSIQSSENTVSGVTETFLTFSSSNTNYCHIWLSSDISSEVSIDEGSYSGKTISVGVLSESGSYIAKVGCWNAKSEYTERILALSCSKSDEVIEDNICKSPSYDNTPWLNWEYKVSDIHTLEYQLEILSSPNKNANIYMQLYDGSIDEKGQYFGLQTNGQAIFSKLDNSVVPEDVVGGTGSNTYYNTDPDNGEGSNFVSVRKDLGMSGSLLSGVYTVKMIRDTFDGIGDWFKYYVTPPSGGEQYIGAIRFTRKNAGIPASYKDGGGTWIEPWNNNATEIVNGTKLPYSVDEFHVEISSKVNGLNQTASKVIGGYSKNTTNSTPNFNNGNINVLSGSIIELIAGHGTIRTNTGVSILWDTDIGRGATDTTSPTVTINVSSGQLLQTMVSPILYTAVFSEPIDKSTFTKGNLSTSGSTVTDIAINSIREIAPYNGTTFEISVLANGRGKVVLSIPDGTLPNSTTLGTTGNSPSGITIDNSGNIYTANYGSNNVTKITPTGSSSILGTTGNSPSGITIDNSGNIYTANYGSNNVTKITPTGSSSILGTTGRTPSKIIIDNLGNIYTSNQESNTVSKISPTGSSSILGTTGNYPYGITIDGSGNIYTSNYGSNNVSKITPTGSSSILGTTGNTPQGITIDNLGNIYATNSRDSTVTKITPTGSSSILGTTAYNPQSIIMDGSGNIYTTNISSSNNVTKISSTGSSSILGTTGNTPLGITIDNLGNIYTANNGNNTVTKITVHGITDLAGNYNLASTARNNEVNVGTNPILQENISGGAAKVESFIMSGTTYLAIPGIKTATGFEAQIIIPSADGLHSIFQSIYNLSSKSDDYIISFHYFSIASGSYLAAGTDGSGTTIYIHSGSTFQPIQHISSPFNISGFTSYTMSGSTYLGIAEDRDTVYGGGYNKTFVWSGTGFIQNQSYSIGSEGDIVYFTIAGQDYIINLGYNTGSIYRWSGTGFTTFVQGGISSNGPSAKVFEIGSDTYLAILNHGGGGVDIYKWNGSQFISTQRLQRGTTGGGKLLLEQFNYNGKIYLLFDTTDRSESQLYQFIGDKFEVVQNIDTRGYDDYASHTQWKYFTIGDQSMLYLAANGYSQKNYIYKWSPLPYAVIKSPTQDTFGDFQNWNAKTTPLSGLGSSGATIRVYDGAWNDIGSGTVTGTGVFSIMTSAYSGMKLPIHVVPYYNNVYGEDKKITTITITNTGSIPSVPDTTSPLVSLIGNNTGTVEYGTTYTDPGATWTDNIDGYGRIFTATSGSVNTGILGTYTLEYKYTDNAGNTGRAYRTITVQDTIAPVITLESSGTVSIDAVAYMIRGQITGGAVSVTISGGSGGSITGNLIGNALNTRVPLIQNNINSLLIAATDAVGNRSTKTLIVDENSLNDDYVSPISISGSTLSGVSIVTGSGITNTTKVTLETPVTFNSGSARTTLPSGTEIKSNSGTSFNASTINLVPVVVTGGLLSNQISNGAIEFGNSEIGLQFSKPIRIEIPVPGYTSATIEIRVRHGGETTFGTVGLTNNPNATCSGGITSIPGSIANVSGGIATIYSCAASTFTAVSAPPTITISQGVSQGGGGPSGGGVSLYAANSMQLGIIGLQEILDKSAVGQLIIKPIVENITEDTSNLSPMKKLITLLNEGYIKKTLIFQSHRTIKRNEFIKIIALTNGYTNDYTIDIHFTDVKQGSTAEGYIAYTAEMGWIDTDSLTFRPNEAITLGEAQNILDRITGNMSEGDEYTDWDSTMTKEEGAVMIFDQLGL